MNHIWSQFPGWTQQISGPSGPRSSLPDLVYDEVGTLPPQSSDMPSGCPVAAQWVMVMVDGHGRSGCHLRIWDFYGVLESQQLTNVRNEWCWLSGCLCGGSFFIFDQSIHGWLPQGASGIREWVSVWRNCFTTFAVGCLTYLPLLSTSFVPAHVLTPIIHARKGFHHSSGKLSISEQTWTNTKKHEQLDSMLTRCNPQHSFNRFSRRRTILQQLEARDGTRAVLGGGQIRLCNDWDNWDALSVETQNSGAFASWIYPKWRTNYSMFLHHVSGYIQFWPIRIWYHLTTLMLTMVSLTSFLVGQGAFRASFSAPKRKPGSIKGYLPRLCDPVCNPL